MEHQQRPRAPDNDSDDDQAQEEAQHENVTFLPSSKGGQKLGCGGFVYNKHTKSKEDESVVFYTCELNKKNNCKARIHVRHGLIMRRLKRHNHAPNGQRGLQLHVCFVTSALYICSNFVIFLGT